MKAMYEYLLDQAKSCPVLCDNMMCVSVCIVFKVGLIEYSAVLIISTKHYISLVFNL